MSLADCTVLIVDDNEGIRSSLADVLTDEGYSVALAGDGQEALKLLRSSAQPAPCLILLDLMMPVMDGFEFRTEQMNDPAISAIPVVVLTADGNMKRKTSAMGAAEGLRKPVSLEDILSVVARYCKPAA